MNNKLIGILSNVKYKRFFIAEKSVAVSCFGKSISCLTTEYNEREQRVNDSFIGLIKFSLKKLYKK